MNFGRFGRRYALALWPLLVVAQATARPTVVELYTSEGCSSCPPAERYLGELAGRPDVLALSFHVDYWDDLGWRDPWALRLFSARQSTYVHQLGLSTPFTPQAIVDGRESFVGSDRSRIGARLGKSQRELSVEVVRENGELLISVAAEPKPTDVVLIPFRRRVRSSIGRGENAGRTLEEFNVARGFRMLGRTRAEPVQWRVSLDSLPQDATDVAVLAQRTEQGEVLGAAQVEIVPLQERAVDATSVTK